MEIKRYRGLMELKQGAQEGEFKVAFATLGVIDADQDVTLPGAFTDGEKVLISAWGHNWNQLPVGRGEIREDGSKAISEGRFFMDTQGGREHHATVKNTAELQQWSYGFNVLESAPGQFDGQEVRFLKKLEVIEVSPVMRGAGVDTQTLDIKSQLKPYPNEHACRLREPGDFQSESFRRTEREHEGKRYSIIMGWLKGETTMTEQAYRYASDAWTEAQARKHCNTHDGATFEPATGKALKAGARHSSKDSEMLQQMHDLAVKLGAECAGHDDSASDGDDGATDKSRKATDKEPRSSTLGVQAAKDLLKKSH
jgi:HK97 family phage prohead protease